MTLAAADRSGGFANNNGNSTCCFQAGFRIQGLGFRVRVSGFEFRYSGLGFQLHHRGRTID